MKTVILHLIVCFLSIPVLGSEKSHNNLSTLVVAIYDFPPHVMVNAKNPRPSGAAIDFLEQALNIHENYRVQWSVSPFSRFLVDLESQKADVGLLLAKTPEREKFVRYSNQAIFTTDSGVILDKNFKFNGIQSLRNMVLGHTQGSVIPAYFTGTTVKFDHLSGEDVVQRNLQRLKFKRIDAVYVPTFSNGEFFLKQLKMEDQFKIVKIADTSLPLYIVFRKSIDETTFNKLNSLIGKKRAQYNLFLNRYFSNQKVTPREVARWPIEQASPLKLGQGPVRFLPPTTGVSF